MKKETLKKIFEFLKENENHNVPFLWKHAIGEPLTEDDLTIDGHLLLEYSRFKSLPNNLKVKGDLSLYHSAIESIPEGLEVGGTLNISGSKITSLPEGLKVGWDLYLDYTMINTLPKGLQVDRDLSITNSPLAKLSDETILSMIEPDGYINRDIIREDNG
jgi:hypothetical protein